MRDASWSCYCERWHRAGLESNSSRHADRPCGQFRRARGALLQGMRAESHFGTCQSRKSPPSPVGSLRRFAAVASQSPAGQRRPVCWPGCHRLSGTPPARGGDFPSARRTVRRPPCLLLSGVASLSIVVNVTARGPKRTIRRQHADRPCSQISGPSRHDSRPCGQIAGQWRI
jgi:hypothetical protein